MVMGGGGAVFGGGVLGGGGFGPSSSQQNAASGLPFSGIPSELAEGVERVLGEEPDHGASTAQFSHRLEDRRRLTMRLLVLRHRRLLATATALVVIEVITLQSGPFLTQIGIDHGIMQNDFYGHHGGLSREELITVVGAVDAL